MRMGREKGRGHGKELGGEMWEGTQSFVGGIVEGPGDKMRPGLNSSPCDPCLIDPVVGAAVAVGVRALSKSVREWECPAEGQGLSPRPLLLAPLS